MDDDFSKMIFTYGVVFRGDLDGIKELKKRMNTYIDDSGLTVIYQKIDPRKMRISVEGEN